MLITPNEQKEKLEYLKELLIREQANNDLIRKLKEEQSLGLADKDKDELNQLRQQFQTLVLEHREQEQQLRKEKWKHETNVEALLHKYDEDMTKKQVILIESNYYIIVHTI